MLDVARRVDLGVGLLTYHGRQRIARGCVDDLDDLLELIAPGVQPATVQYGRHRQRRRRGVVDGAPAAVETVPPAAAADLVDDVEVEQLDAMARHAVFQ